MDKGDTVIDGGLVDIAMSYRKELMPDQGLCIQVYSEIDGHDTEILRFDCFDQDPHYHYGPENHNIRLHLDKTTAGNPVGWTMDNIRNKLPAMVRRSGYDALADGLEANPYPRPLWTRLRPRHGTCPATSAARSITSCPRCSTAT